MNTLTEAQKGYLAGLLDGEGCLSISKHNSHYGVHVQITNTNEIMMNSIIHFTGLGGVYKDNRRPGQRKPTFNWIISDRVDIAEFLIAVRPYLIDKSIKSDILIKYCLLKISKIYVDCEALYLQMKELNKKGI